MDTGQSQPSPFRPFTRLVAIQIRGKTFGVPEGNPLLRGFQYLCPEPISNGRYCWNEECQYCRVTVTRPDGHVQQALSCKLIVEDGLAVEELSSELLWNLRSLFNGGDSSSSSGAV